jgi:hypothetical protein
MEEVDAPLGGRLLAASSTRTPAATAARTSGDPVPARCAATRASTSAGQPM